MKAIFALYITLWTVGELGTIAGLLSGHLGVFAVGGVLWVAAILIVTKDVGGINSKDHW